jgi:hypothetical protein
LLGALGYACRTAVTVRLRSGFVPAWQIDPKLSLWLMSLATLAAVNFGLWIWIARSVSLRTPHVETQLLLSGVYVGVCGFRSLFPRVDLERVCLWDTRLSSILLGRTAATIAELCFALQCGLFLRRLSEVSGMPLPDAVSHAFVPLVILAELFCWYAVLSLNHVGHAIEESIWALLMLVLAGALGTAALVAQGTLQGMLVAGCLVYGIGAGLTIAFDVRMYVRRWRRSATGVYLPLATGLRDSHRRRHPTLAWEVWRAEVPWMTLYFSIGVWTSLAMVLFGGVTAVS